MGYMPLDIVDIQRILQCSSICRCLLRRMFVRFSEIEEVGDMSGGVERMSLKF